KQLSVALLRDHLIGCEAIGLLVACFAHFFSSRWGRPKASSYSSRSRVRIRVRSPASAIRIVGAPAIQIRNHSILVWSLIGPEMRGATPVRARRLTRSSP